MFHDSRDFDADAIVIDPAVPAAARQALEAGYWAAKAASGRRGPNRPGARWNAARSARPIPFGQSARRAPPPPRVMSAGARMARLWAVGTLAFLAGALIAAAAGSLPFVVALLVLTAVATALCARAVLDAGHAGWTVIVTEAKGELPRRDPRNWFALHAAAYYHGRYVVPQADIAGVDKPVWDRAVAAAEEIHKSDVFRQQRIDSVQVAVYLPHRLWEIAETLARLSRVRERLHVKWDDPGDDGRMASRGRKLTRIAKDIEKRVEKLERVAAKMEEADAALRKVADIEARERRLKEIDDLLLDLRSRTEATPEEPDLTERVRLEVQAVIEQANEAARSLAVPGEDDGDDKEDHEEEELDA